MDIYHITKLENLIETLVNITENKHFVDNYEIQSNGLPPQIG